MTIDRYLRPCDDGQLFIVNITGHEFDAVVGGMSDAQSKMLQGWYKRGEMDKVVTHLLFFRMESHAATEVLSCCNSALSEQTAIPHGRPQRSRASDQWKTPRSHESKTLPGQSLACPDADISQSITSASPCGSEKPGSESIQPGCPSEISNKVQP